MEKKKSNIYIIVLIILVTIIGIYTLYKKQKRHEEKLYSVLYNNISYNAKKCYLNKECSEKIILNDLYEKGYLETLYDPISKEEIDKNIIITISDETVDFEI